MSATAPSDIVRRLDELRDLALDLRWAWRPDVRDFFLGLDPDGRLTGARDPWAIVRFAPTERLKELLADPTFCATLERLTAERTAYLADGGWYGRTHDGTREPLVAVSLVIVGAASGLLLLATGSRPADGLHLLYAFIAIALIPLARSFLGRTSGRRASGLLLVAFVVLGAVVYRLFTTG